MNPLSRRIFLKATGAAALVPAAQGASAQAAPGHAPHAAAAAASAAGGPMQYLFFTPAEQAFIEAAVVRLIPPDEVGPSALQAGVPSYLDKQLGGAWGAGERLYRSGPWQPGTPTQGYQLPFTPAELFRNALRAIQADLQASRGTTFDKLSGADQDAYLTQLQNGHADLSGVPSNVFFESLLGMTIEGYFSDPVYGGNFGMAAWKMIGFPGAYGSFYDLVDQHGIHFPDAPRSIGENGRGHIELHPDIPAAVHPSTTRS